MNTEQIRADFEAWHAEKYWAPLFDDELGRFTPTVAQNRFEAYQAGRAALQSQDREDATLRVHIRNLTTIVRMPNAEHVADKHNDAVEYLRERFIDRARRIEGS